MMFDDFDTQIQADLIFYKKYYIIYIENKKRFKK